MSVSTINCICSCVHLLLAQPTDTATLPAASYMHLFTYTVLGNWNEQASGISYRFNFELFLFKKRSIKFSVLYNYRAARANSTLPTGQ